jgi:hypothetical protein
MMVKHFDEKTGHTFEIEDFTGLDPDQLRFYNKEEICYAILNAFKALVDYNLEECPAKQCNLCSR